MRASHNPHLPSADELEAPLGALANRASGALENVDGVGVFVRQDAVELVSASNAFAHSLDALQRTCGEGPCRAAIATGRPVLLRSTTTEARWPGFVGSAHALGVRSVLSVPLWVRGAVVGAINLHSRTSNGFDDDAASAGELFAAAEAATLVVLGLLHHFSAFAGQTWRMMEESSRISIAAGVMHATRPELSASGARRLLHELAVEEGVPVSTVAERVIADLELR